MHHNPRILRAVVQNGWQAKLSRRNKNVTPAPVTICSSEPGMIKMRRVCPCMINTSVSLMI